MGSPAESAVKAPKKEPDVESNRYSYIRTERQQTERQDNKNAHTALLSTTPQRHAFALHASSMLRPGVA